jgi:TaqI-like C-terminal specificity domain
MDDYQSRARSCKKEACLVAKVINAYGCCSRICYRPRQGVYNAPRNCSRGEEKVYIDYLPDRQIGRYSLPKRSEEVVFFPYRAGVALDEEDLRKEFPKTWEYLLKHRDVLQTRKSVGDGGPWWRPTRSRPQTILKPKIVCPHLLLTPRFAVDMSGNFAVSHGPFVTAKDVGEERVLLNFFCAVLNSTACNWYLRASAPKYGKGYNRVEVSSLSDIPVPSLDSVDSSRLISIADAVDTLSKRYSEQLDDEVDRDICEIYGFSASERSEILGLK